MTGGALLRSWRERAQLTQEELARRTGVSVRTVRRLEAGTVHRPRIESLRLLAIALALTPAEAAQLHAAVQRSGTTPVPTVPRCLPADLPTFVGRTQYLDTLDGLLDRADQPVTVAGRGDRRCR
jgi:transcriptional regulator with XRE-family HTH domain